MWVHRVTCLTHHADSISIWYEYKIYGENVQEMHVSNRGRDILIGFGWDPKRSTYVSRTIDRILQHQGFLRLRGHTEPFVELYDLDEFVRCSSRECNEQMPLGDFPVPSVDSNPAM